MQRQRERGEVAQAARDLVAAGLVVGTSGNVSQRAGELVAITPSGVPADRLDAAAVCLVDREGRQVDGELVPSSELGMHLAAYARRPLGAVVHTHSPYATAAGAVVDELPAVHYLVATLGGPLRVVPYATYGTPELAAAAATGLADRDAVLLRNHGVTTVGADLAAAHARAVTVEWLCQVVALTRAFGTPATLDAAELDHVAAQLRNYGQPPP